VADEPETVVPVEDAPDVAGAGEGSTAAEDTPVSRAEVERNRRVRRNLLLLSLANWGIAIVAWSLSAYLGVASPASIMVYTILFLIGLFAALVAFAAYVLERFAHRPELPAPEAVDVGEPGTAAGPPA
jgi:hypothetical protein